jgi:hypothetical protein
MNRRLVPRDEKDKKRVRDLERVFQTRELKRYDTDPDIKQVRNNSAFIVSKADGTKYIGIRVDGEILKVQVS